MPEGTDTLDLAIEDVSEASWEELVKIMMADELDITGISACGTSGCGGCGGCSMSMATACSLCGDSSSCGGCC